MAGQCDEKEPEGKGPGAPRNKNLMPKLTVDLRFAFQGKRQDYTKEFDADRDLDRDALDFHAAQMFRECHMQVLYSRHRRTMSNFQTLSLQW